MVSAIRQLAIAILWLLACQGVAAAQESKYPPWYDAYAYFGRGSYHMGSTAGLGLEGSLYGGLGLNLDLGAAGMGASSNGNRNVIGVGSADFTYRLFTKSIRVRGVPFVLGGYTMFFGQDVYPKFPGPRLDRNIQNGYNLGAGIDLLATRHVGARFDVRYYGHGARILWASFPKLSQLSFTAFRIGFTIR